MSYFERVISCNFYVIFKQVCLYLDECDMCRMRRVNRMYCDLFLSVLMEERNVAKLLRRYIGAWSSFRKCLRSAGAVLSGGVVTQFFSRQRWADSDLDVFVPKGKCEEIGVYLEQEMGYTPKEVSENKMLEHYAATEVGNSLFWRLCYLFCKVRGLCERRC